MQAVKELKLDAVVCRTGCIGFCAKEPLLDLVLPDGPRLSYGEMTPQKTRDLLTAYAVRKDPRLDLALARFSAEEHLSTGELHEYPHTARDMNGLPEWANLDFIRRQKKVILRNCGSIDPLVIEEAIGRGAITARSAPSPR